MHLFASLDSAPIFTTSASERQKEAKQTKRKNREINPDGRNFFLTMMKPERNKAQIKSHTQAIPKAKALYAHSETSMDTQGDGLASKAKLTSYILEQ